MTDEDKQWLDRFEARLDAKLDALETRMNAKIEHVETSLLTEFHKWASPVEIRARAHSALLHAVELSLDAVSDRVTKLEGGAAGKTA